MQKNHGLSVVNGYLFIISKRMHTPQVGTSTATFTKRFIDRYFLETFNI